MHRTINISLPSADSQSLCDEIAALETVVGVSLAKGNSIKPPGDVITVDVLNKGADDVLKLVAAASEKHELSITTHEAASFIDPKKSEVIEDDVDEAIWEEMETGLRHQGRITSNYIALMALGGAICAVGLVSEPAPQAIAFAASAIIAPGFEPLAKIPLGIVLGRWHVAWRGLTASLAGYAVLILSAALVMFILLQTGSVELSELVKNPELKHIAHPTLKEFTVSGAGAIAGMIIISAYRRSVIAGALIALVIIPAAASIGAGIAAGERHIIYNGLERLGIDVLFIIVAGLIVFWLKQVFVHRRKPLI
jgi:hypothetical protein